VAGKTNSSRILQIAFTVSVSPDNDNDLPGGVTRGLMVGTDGDVSVTYANGLEDTIYLAAGSVHQIAAARVRALGTTATLIKACY
jgi:hypothetical protein